jgi:four helix bundle protein
VQDFRGVRAWESALIVAKKTRELVRKFPRSGYAELREQMIAAAESISHNIAEGRAASRESEFLRFLDIAARSASELSSQAELVKTYGIAPEREAFNLIGSIICTRRMIRSMQQTIRLG